MKTVHTAGIDIPVLGLGVWQIATGGADIVADAIAAGYRHVDTAAVYRNEADVGEGVRRSGVPRDRIHVTTKVWRDNLAAGDLQRAAETSLKTLGLDYVDLLLIHWPNPATPLEETMAALNDVHRRGLARAIGVSNFPSKLFAEAARLSDVPLVTNQVEYHPYLSQRAVLETVRREGSTLTAWSPLARGLLAGDPVLTEIGQAHGKSPVQTALRWLVQQDRVIAIPKSASPERLRQNFDIWDFELGAAEIARIDALVRPDGRFVDPFGVEWDRD